MPRQNRKYGTSQIYHIMLRGINKSLIFFDDFDKKKFLKILKDTKEKYSYEIYAYCLMDNHVHIVIFDQLSLLSKIIQSITVSYSSYINTKYDRVGHLFQNRFLSKCIENDIYLKSLINYIHQNPEKAGICSTCNYKWSSYNEVLTTSEIVDKKFILLLYDNDLQKFKKDNLNLKDGFENEIEYEFITNIEDSKAIQIIKEKLHISDVSIIVNFNSTIRNNYIKEIKQIKGLTRTQICRILNISKKMYDRIK